MGKYGIRTSDFITWDKLTQNPGILPKPTTGRKHKKRQPFAANSLGIA